MRSSKILLTVAAVCLLALAVFVVFSRRTEAPHVNGKKAAGTVNGEPFFQEDLDAYAAELRAAVAADYGRRFGLSVMGADFWDTRYGGSTPRKTLHKMALTRLVRNIVLIQEARLRGIDTPKNYRDLEAEREIRNTPGGDIVYGPKQLGVAEFTSYRVTGISDDLKTELLKKELAPTEAQLRAAFDSLPVDIKHAPWFASGTIFRWDGPPPAGPTRAAFRRALNDGLSPQAAREQFAAFFPGLSYEDFEIDSRYTSSEPGYQYMLTESLKGASAGDLIPGPEEQPELYYVKVKEGGGIFRFEDAPGLGRNKWINDQFEIFLDKKVKAAKVRLFRYL